VRLFDIYYNNICFFSNLQLPIHFHLQCSGSIIVAIEIHARLALSLDHMVVDQPYVVKQHASSPRSYRCNYSNRLHPSLMQPELPSCNKLVLGNIPSDNFISAAGICIGFYLVFLNYIYLFALSQTQCAAITSGPKKPISSRYSKFFFHHVPSDFFLTSNVSAKCI